MSRAGGRRAGRALRGSPRCAPSWPGAAGPSAPSRSAALLPRKQCRSRRSRRSHGARRPRPPGPVDPPTGIADGTDRAMRARRPSDHALPSPARQIGPAEATAAALSPKTWASSGAGSVTSRHGVPAGGIAAEEDRETKGTPAPASVSIAGCDIAVNGAMTAPSTEGSAATARAASSPCVPAVSRTSTSATSSSAISSPSTAGETTERASGNEPSWITAIRGADASEPSPPPHATATMMEIARTAAVRGCRVRERIRGRSVRGARDGSLGRPAGRDGGTGRRAGLKIPWASARAGSTPAPGTGTTCGNAVGSTTGSGPRRVAAATTPPPIRALGRRPV